ncbi:outer membrane beta-barrel protein [Spirosoma gilvum]
MRKLFVLGLLLIAYTSHAQTATALLPSKAPNPFKVVASVGYASPVDLSGNKSLGKAGFVYSLEPQYEVAKNLDLGARIEQAFILRPEYIDKTYYKSALAKFTLSLVATANYTFNVTSSLKPYIGTGVGLYYVQASDPTYTIGSTIATYPLPTTINLGGIARLGVKFGIAHLEAAYDFIGDTSVRNTSTGLTLTGSNSYYSIKAGLRFGGR